MKRKQFRKNLILGLGSALIELQNEKNHDEAHREALLFACLNNTRFDDQTEDHRTQYLYEAIQLFGEPNYFEERIIEKIFKASDAYLVEQLGYLLCQFVKAGSEKAELALEKRHLEFYKAMNRKSNQSFWNTGECFQRLSFILIHLQGIRFFYKIAEMIVINRNWQEKGEIGSFDWLFSAMELDYGKEYIHKQLEKRIKNSQLLKKFFKEKEIEEVERETKWQEKKKRTVTLDQFLEEFDKDTSTNKFRSKMLAPYLVKNSSTKVVFEMIDLLKSDLDISKKKVLLWGMSWYLRRNKDSEVYDQMVDLYKDSEDQEMRRLLLEILEKEKNKELLQIALANLYSSIFVEESLAILLQNLRGQEEEYCLIWSVIKQYRMTNLYGKNSEMLHGFSLNLDEEIFKKSNSETLRKILLHLYHENPCSFCRTKIVKILCKTQLMLAEILAECLYDCSEETRKVARRYTKRIGGVQK